MDVVQGNWTVVVFAKKGAKQDDAALASLAAAFDKDTFHLVEVRIPNANFIEKCVVRVDPSKEPHEIDLVHIEGDLAGQVRPGIVAREGDRLKLCWAETGKGRPTAFAAKADPEWTLLVLKRKE